MEDHGNSIGDYMNGNEEDGDDGDEEDDLDYGIHERIRQRMRSKERTNMELEGYLLGDYLTGSRYDSIDRCLYTLNKELSDVEENNMSDCLPTTDAGEFAYQNFCWNTELRGIPSHVIMNQVGNLCNRYNHPILGTNSEQNFIQPIEWFCVSTVTCDVESHVTPRG